jgi:hypothetical protein
MHQGLQKITLTQLILDLGLMCDALSELNLHLQERNIVMYIANKNPNSCSDF